MSLNSTSCLRIRIFLLFLGLMAAAVHHRIQVRYDYFKQIRLRHHEEVLSGLITPPYRYRVLTPYVAEALRRAIKGFWGPGEAAQMQCFVLVYFCLAFAAFAVTYQCFFGYLRQWFTQSNALLGCLLLFAVTPLTITGFVDGDFVTLALVCLGLWCFCTGREMAVPLLLFIGAWNRIQILFLPALWLAHRLGSGRRMDRRAWTILALCAAAFVVPYVTLRLWLGDPGSVYTMRYHMVRNWQHLPTKILYVWAPNVLVFLGLALCALRACPRQLQYSFALIPIYLAVFFVKGNLWELAKALPMYLVLIPMSLVALVGRGEMTNDGVPACAAHGAAGRPDDEGSPNA